MDLKKEPECPPIFYDIAKVIGVKLEDGHYSVEVISTVTEEFPDKQVYETHKHQSPIDLSGAVSRSIIPQIIYSGYENPFQATIENEGHTLKVVLRTEGLDKPYIGVGNSLYDLDSFHFHWQAEHTIESVRHPLEAHFVHINRKYGTVEEAKKHWDGIAVLGVIYALSKHINPALDSLIEGIPAIAKHCKHPVLLRNTIVLRDFLPRSIEHFYRYHGSLTTPPFSPAVIWTIYQELSNVSAEELKKFEIYDEHGELCKKNCRETQSKNGNQVFLK